MRVAGDGVRVFDTGQMMLERGREDGTAAPGCVDPPPEVASVDFLLEGSGITITLVAV